MRQFREQLEIASESHGVDDDDQHGGLYILVQMLTAEFCLREVQVEAVCPREIGDEQPVLVPVAESIDRLSGDPGMIRDPRFSAHHRIEESALADIRIACQRHMKRGRHRVCPHPGTSQ